MEEEIQSQSTTLPPEYYEKLLKDLMSNIYNVGDDNSVTGIGAESPLYGKPVVDEAGNPVYELDETGQPALDQYGNPIQKVSGGVPPPDAIRFTDDQKRALDMVSEGIGAYKPYTDRSEELMEKGVTAADAMMGKYDPSSYQEYMDPYVEDVVDTTYADIQRTADIERARMGGRSVSTGAFGGSRQAVAEQELQRNTADIASQRGAELRSAAYTQAQDNSMRAFDNQMTRNQNASTLFQGLGTSMAGLGGDIQQLGMTDSRNLFDAGSLEQSQLQTEYDTGRSAAIEEAYEPYTRFSYVRDMISGIPASQSTLAVAGGPKNSSLSNIVGTTAQMGGLGSIK
jgi:hypothetical protein|tara:strand:+ start:8829 stop:9851 length:1023 start_codon:yes stop_codon:yes gene_type:complete